MAERNLYMEALVDFLRNPFTGPRDIQTEPDANALPPRIELYDPRKPNLPFIPPKGPQLPLGHPDRPSAFRRFVRTPAPWVRE